ncbi:MAG: 50S ribosome-binding GTPase [Acidobacteria bacterium]|nr:50S ribosome-binding GTPase [Acidobacteriota bacterium]
MNRVDEVIPGGWNSAINLPTDDAAVQIDRKCADIKRLIASGCGISETHIEHYSALKRYRLENLLNCVIRNCYAGFKLSDVQPKHFEDVDGVNPDARKFTKEERRRRLEKSAPRVGGSARDEVFADLSKVVSVGDLRLIEQRFNQEMERPPTVAVIGQAGVGKTTTVNALFSVEWKTSAIGVGTHVPQGRTVALPSGGQISVTDLPGYGRSIKEDETYERMYHDVMTDCDLVLLIVQADRGDFADDQEMILKIKEWMS